MRLFSILFAVLVVMIGGNSVIAEELNIQPYDFGASSQSSGTSSYKRRPAPDTPPPQRPLPNVISNGYDVPSSGGDIDAYVTDDEPGYVDGGYPEPGVSGGWAGPDGGNQMLPYDPNPPVLHVEKRCGHYPQWIGQKVDEKAVLATGKTYRILSPHSMVTQDYSADRINVYIDDNNIVIDVRCG